MCLSPPGHSSDSIRAYELLGVASSCLCKTLPGRLVVRLENTVGICAGGARVITCKTRNQRASWHVFPPWANALFSRAQGRPPANVAWASEAAKCIYDVPKTLFLRKTFLTCSFGPSGSSKGRSLPTSRSNLTDGNYICSSGSSSNQERTPPRSPIGDFKSIVSNLKFFV
jgi:hypothetical protein